MVYIIVENDVIVNRVVCNDSQFAESQGWEVDDNFAIGWVRDGDTFAPVEEEL